MFGDWRKFIDLISNSKAGFNGSVQVVISPEDRHDGITNELIDKAIMLNDLFNHYIKDKKLTNKYSLIGNGEKIKFIYLKKPNIIQENVVSFIQDFPHELGLDKYIDYELQFQKSFVEPLKAILDAIGWNVEKTVNLELFFG